MKPDKEITAEQVILETAESLFLEKGFALTSTTEIARVAGCNQALVHYYFRTKERLFDIVFEKYATLFVSALLVRVEDNLSFEEKVRKRAETLFDILKTHPKLPFLLLSELNANPERLLHLMKKSGVLPGLVFSEMESELRVEIEKGHVRPMTATDLILTILSMNLVLFLAAPALKAMAGMNGKEFEKLVENRKRETVTVILKSLRP